MTGPVGERAPTGAGAVHPDEVIVAIDVGGSSLKPGVVEGRSVATLPPAPIAPSDDAPTLLDKLAAAVCAGIEHRAARGAGAGSLVEVAIAFPDPFDRVGGRPLLRGQQKFDALYGVPLRPELQARNPVPLRISFWNDAEAAAVGEATSGAGTHRARVLMVTLGTGFGAALVVDGTPVPVVDGLVVGDLWQHESTAEAASDRPGHGPSTSERSIADDVLSARGLADRIGCSPAELPRAVADPTSAAIIEGYGRDLGRFLIEKVPVIAPDVIVIGGGLSAAFPAFGPAAAVSAGVEIVPASLGATGPLLGVAELHRRDPGPSIAPTG